MRHLPAYHLVVLLVSLVACGDFPGRRGDAPQPRCEAHEAPQASGGQTAFTGKQWGTDAQRETVRGWIKRLMDEPRTVRGGYGKPDGVRGGPGNFDKLSSQAVDEYISALIYAGEMFMPKSLSWDQKSVLLATEVSIESAFVVGTAGANPGNTSMTSVGCLQWTKEIWTPIFQRQPDIAGLTHYDGSPWRPADTTDDMMIHSIWDNIIASTWAITSQGKQGGPDNIGGPDGPMPKQFFSGCLCWVLGAPAARSGGDLAEQRLPYRFSMEADLKMLGFDTALLDTQF